MIKLFRTLMILWYTAAVVSIGFGIHRTMLEGFEASYIFFIITTIGGMMGEINRRRAAAAAKSTKPENEKQPNENV